MSTFIDDIKVMRMKKSDYIKKVKQELAAAFEMVNIGLINFYLGLKVKSNYEKKTLKIFQPTYIKKILA